MIGPGNTNVKNFDPSLLNGQLAEWILSRLRFSTPKNTKANAEYQKTNLRYLLENRPRRTGGPRSWLAEQTLFHLSLLG